MTVELTGVTKRHRRGAETVLALDNLTLTLHPGELTVAAGPSGSGKTTLLSLVAGLDTPDLGVVRLGPPLPARPPADLPWSKLAFIPQSPALLDELTVRENITLPARLAGLPADPEPLLDELDITALADRHPSHTSGGEQQRTAIATALLLRPTLIVADEPTAHQDRDRVDLVLDLLRRRALNGAIVLVSSHDDTVIEAADRVIHLEDGKILSGTPSAPGP